MRRADAFDCRVADLLQDGLPLTERPYLALAGMLGCAEADVLEAVRRLAADGTIRSFGAFVDYGRLGYEGFLCGASVPEAAIPRVAAFLNEKREVTHNYLRAGEVNLWFTAILRPNEIDSLEVELRGLGHPFVLLRTERRIKLMPCFHMGGEREAAGAGDVEGAGLSRASPGATEPMNRRGAPGAEDVALLAALQEAFPIEPAPYARIAQRFGVDTDTLLARLTALRRDGVLRRIGASLHHLRAGYAANALLALDYGAPEADLAAGTALAEYPWLSHCYLRSVASCTLSRAWPYRLYAMIHAKSGAELRERISVAGDTWGLRGMCAMGTVRELKKARYLLE